MMVIVVLSMLAVMLMPLLSRTFGPYGESTPAEKMTTFARAFESYYIDHGSWPTTGDAGMLPADMAARINETAWTQLTPGDGHWNWEGASIGIQAGISLLGCTLTDAELAKIDATIDDGNVYTGKFRRFQDGRPVYVLVD